jgi:hypothetical protein
MANLVDVKVQGGAALDKALLKIGHKAAGSKVKRAMRNALKPLQDKIRERIVSDLNTMHAQVRAVYSKQIGISVNVVRGGVRGRIKTNSKKVNTGKSFRNFARLAHLFEGGTKPHTIEQPKRKRTIKHPGIKANPIWEETFNNLQPRIEEEFRNFLFEDLFGR